MSHILTHSLTGWDRIIHIFESEGKLIGVTTTCLSKHQAHQLIITFNPNSVHKTFLLIDDYEQKVRSNTIKACDKIIWTN